MGLFSFLKRPSAVAPAAAGGDPAQAVEAARTRARRRLIGAVLLLGVGVIAFPLLFETQPRPIPVDIPIEIPRKDGAPPLAVPPARPALASAAAVTESKVEPAKEVVAPAPVAPAPMPLPAPKAVEPKPAPTAPAKNTPAPTPRAAQPPASPAAETQSDSAARFVVQVGAFADAALAREARAKLEKLGLHTYTQAVDTDNGRRTRVRLGPFASRDDAEQAAAKVKAAGLPAAVLTL